MASYRLKRKHRALWVGRDGHPTENPEKAMAFRHPGLATTYANLRFKDFATCYEPELIEPDTPEAA